MSMIYEEYAPEARPRIAVGSKSCTYESAVQYTHNVFFMTADQLMEFYRKMRIIR